MLHELGMLPQKYANPRSLVQTVT